MSSIDKALEYIKNAEYEIEQLPRTYKFANGHHQRYQECMALVETLRRSVMRLKAEIVDAILENTAMDDPPTSTKNG